MKLLYGALSFLPLSLAVKVTLESAELTGISQGKTESFLGIPYAQPPTGQNRFRLPQPLSPYKGSYNTSSYGPSCPQHPFGTVDLSPLPPPIAEFLSGLFAGGGSTHVQSEDCLTVNVIRPKGVKNNAKLPVVVWIYGGGFQTGSSSEYNGTAVVEHSISLGQPIVYVSLNYRVAGFGFMPGKEIKAAGVGNLGLQDQRFALRWVQKYVSRFGGDPRKTTIWGQSAGAISASFQMLANKGRNEDLFRGAFMQSGAPWSIDPIERGQRHYDAIVNGTSCGSATDTLDCLRQIPYEKMKEEMDKIPSLLSPEGLALSFGPRVDGVFFPENPWELVSKGHVARVPVVQGNCDDEGTTLAIPILSINTTQGLRSFLNTYFFPRASTTQLDDMFETYPQDPAFGSPFDTGLENNVTPQFKRIAALLGDLVFQAPRRHFLSKISSGRQPSWSYLYKRQKSFPVLGSFHGADVFTDIFAGGLLADHLVYFVNNLDPNPPVATSDSKSRGWPMYEPATRKLLTFYDEEAVEDGVKINVTRDAFREKEIKFLQQFLVVNPM